MSKLAGWLNNNRFADFYMPTRPGKWLSLSLAVLVSGCAVDNRMPNQPVYDGVTRLQMGIEYVGPDNQQLPAEQFTREIVLKFPLVPAGIFGVPRSRSLFFVQADDDLHFTLDLQENLSSVESAARPLSRKWRSRGLTIEPANTRLARLGTFPYHADTHRSLGGGGFINPVNRDTLILLYVDRPCEIRGQFTIEEEQFAHDLAFDRAGFHWIRISSPGPDKFKLVPYPDNGPALFSIHVMGVTAL